MNQKCKVIILLILLFCSFAFFLPFGRAVEEVSGEDVYEQQSQAVGMGQLESAVPDEVHKAAGGVSLGDTGNFDEALGNMLQYGTSQIGGFVGSALRSGAIILVIVLLCAMAEGLNTTADQKVSDGVVLAGVLAITFAAIGDVQMMINLGRECIQGIDQFSKALLPTLSAASMASGAPTAAMAKYMATAIFSDVLITVISRLLIPLVYVYIACCCAGAAISGDTLGRLASFIKWVITSILCFITSIFVLYLGVSGTISGSNDAAVIKSTKLALSSAIPVVGSIIGDAADTILSSATLLKNSIGIIGLLTVLGVCLLPFLQLGVQYIIYKVTAAMSTPLGDGRFTKLIDGIGSGFALILGMTASCALMMMISIISAMSSVMH